MVVLMFGLYFLAAILVLWLVVFPSQRDALIARVLRLFRSGFSGTRSGASRAGRGLRTSARATRGSAWRALDFLVRHRLVALCLFLLLTFPPLVVLHMQGLLNLSALVPHHQLANPVVAQLLEGEKLVPPQPLPPDVFTTREVEEIRPGIAHANRKWDALKPDFRQRLLAVFQAMREQYGYQMVLIEGYRSPARQDELMDRDSHTTHAGAFQSYHQFGLAADCGFFRDGKLKIARDDAWIRRGYALYGRLAEQYGLTWGGKWTLQDYGHVELRGSKYPDPTDYR